VLLVSELPPQDVCVPAVLSELAQLVEMHPAHWERPRRLPRTVSSRPRYDVARGDASHASRCACLTVAIVSSSRRVKDSSGVVGIPIWARDRQVTASSNQAFSTNAVPQRAYHRDKVAA
jgi:hypothetical protein